MSSVKIIVLIPYFGQWPAWFLFFLKTCEYNHDIKWLFYTDCGIPDKFPKNVTFNEITYSDYLEKISDKLGLVFNPDHPYKLCDLKPALGFIHEDAIQGFDFWGFSDLDLIYGNLRKYYTDEKLNKYDIFSTHERRVSGHFCLMRNNKKMREAFMLIKNWKERFSDSQHYALDEGAFSKIFIKHKNFPKPLFNLFGKLNSWRRKGDFVEQFSTPNAGVPWLDGSYNFPQEWYWEDGQVTNDMTGDKDYLYFHFFSWKSFSWDENVIFDTFDDHVKKFKISPKGLQIVA